MSQGIRSFSLAFTLSSVVLRPKDCAKRLGQGDRLVQRFNQFKKGIERELSLIKIKRLGINTYQYPSSLLYIPLYLRLVFLREGS